MRKNTKESLWELWNHYQKSPLANPLQGKRMPRTRQVSLDVDRIIDSLASNPKFINALLEHPKLLPRITNQSPIMFQSLKNEWKSTDTVINHQPGLATCIRSIQQHLEDIQNEWPLGDCFTEKGNPHPENEPIINIQCQPLNIPEQNIIEPTENEELDAGDNPPNVLTSTLAEQVDIEKTGLSNASQELNLPEENQAVIDDYNHTTIENQTPAQPCDHGEDDCGIDCSTWTCPEFKISSETTPEFTENHAVKPRTKIYRESCLQVGTPLHYYYSNLDPSQDSVGLDHRAFADCSSTNHQNLLDKNSKDNLQLRESYTAFESYSAMFQKKGEFVVDPMVYHHFNVKRNCTNATNQAQKEYIEQSEQIQRISSSESGPDDAWFKSITNHQKIRMPECNKMLQFIGKLSNVSELVDTVSTSDPRREMGYLERRLSKLGLFQSKTAPTIRIKIPARKPAKPANFVGNFRGLYRSSN